MSLKSPSKGITIVTDTDEKLVSTLVVFSEPYVAKGPQMGR